MKKFVIRAVLGVISMLGINAVLRSKGIGMTVGINEISILATGILGAPGVALLYGMIMYPNL